MVWWTPVILGGMAVAAIFFDRGYSIPFVTSPSDTGSSNRSVTSDSVGSMLGMFGSLIGWLTSDGFITVLMLLLILQVVSIISNVMRK